MIEAFLFDMDGTLLDTEVLWVEATRDYLRDNGCSVTPDEALTMVYGIDWADICEDILRRFPHLDLTPRAIADAVTPYFALLRDTRDVRIADSIGLFKRLSRDYPVAIVSGSDRRSVAHGIELMDIAPHVRFFLAAEDYAPGKPHPACYRMAAERLALPPERCLAFEDSAAGIRAAKGAGLHCVALARKDRPRQNVGEADLALESLADFSVDEFNARF
ncbi:MAG: hypothetical protein QG656_2665 [Candidatus Hydrogenedentes bacterium]|nr:hypothetical protein [Candidatus Hydrogenedentota bacterium]